MINTIGGLVCMYPGEYFRYFSFVLCFFGACCFSLSLVACWCGGRQRRAISEAVRGPW